jgi:hypothetical protein
VGCFGIIYYMNDPRITPEVISAMREWVSDCSWGEGPEEIEEMSDTQIVRGVARHFDGGIEEFLRTL